MAMKESGFTVIELLVTIAIGAILLGIATPALRDYVTNGRITTATNDLVAAFNVARAEAIRQTSFSCVCASTTASDPMPSCSLGNDWETGWIAFLDRNGNCVLENGAQPDVLLKAWDGTEFGAMVTVRNANVGNNTVRFNSRGETEQLNGRSQWGLFRICDDRGVQLVNGNSTTAVAVVLSPSGRARTSRAGSKLPTCP